MLHYFIIYKPYEVLSQFSPEQGKHTLKDHFKVPPDVYPVGRLDFDSEGLLLLTNDTSLNHRLLNPSFAHEREYLVQVDGAVTAEAIRQLEAGLVITINGKSYTTRPAKVIHHQLPPAVPERNPPVRFRKLIPTSWISLILTEGKNRQVRKMTAKAGFPTLRLIRTRIGNLRIGNLQPGEMLALDRSTVYQDLFGHFDRRSFSAGDPLP